ncbi:J domain-containing protein [Halorussus amylolyticus]|uniref:J domain-containing protein n=1 Tax=Halorussus amylolyticus TaxID=1126242 RepID=UPI0010493195|nr:J domain-containing protein [Halorussus amylolyticus]
MSSDLDWPTQFDRTDPAERTPNNQFGATVRETIDDLETELDRLGVDNWRLSTAASHQKMNPKYPYADANPDDPSAVVRWRMDGAQYAVACDAYSRLRDNLRTLYLYIQEKRKMEKRPVETGESEFANARLPPGDAATEAVVAREPPHEVLDVAPGADEAVVKAAARQLKKKHHPDAGGDESLFKRVVSAEEAMLR